MLANITTSFQNVLSGLAYQPFTLAHLADFPISEYNENLDRYLSAWKWFTGEALKPAQGESEQDSLYPVRINPLLSTVLKHAYALYGEYADDGRPLVIPRLVLDEPKSQKKIAREAEKALNMLWWESFGRAIQMENGISSQIFGGCVYMIRHIPWDKSRNIPFRIERWSPEQFVGSLLYGDPYRLGEAWLIRPINVSEAEKYGVTVKEGTPCWWIEKWTPEEYHIRINDKTVNYRGSDGVEYPGQGPNIWGHVPVVYIPHIRVQGLYGINNIDHLKGLVEEINLRFGDIGDAVNADTHQYVAIKNTVGNVPIRHLALGLDALDLGNSGGITGNEPEPDIKEIRKPQTSQPMLDFIDELLDEYRRDAFVPKVADGEDEGSQRSAATLVARMWPLISHINQERINQTAGLDWLTVMALRMMSTKGVQGVSAETLRMRTRQEWAPVLPKDREVFVNELVNRAANNLGSPEHLLEMTGDVEDVEDEVEKVKEWLRFQAEVTADATAKANAAIYGNQSQQSQQKGSGSDGNKNPKALKTSSTGK